MLTKRRGRPRARPSEASLGLGDLLAYPLGGGTTAAQARTHGTFDGEHGAHLGGQRGRGLGELLVGQVGKLHSPGLGQPHARTGNLVRIAEGHPLLDEPLCDVGSKREALVR